jgi:hypothetical protein
MQKFGCQVWVSQVWVSMSPAFHVTSFSRLVVKDSWSSTTQVVLDLDFYIHIRWFAIDQAWLIDPLLNGICAGFL